MASFVRYLGFSIPADIVAAEPYRRSCPLCLYVHAPKDRYAGPADCARCRKRTLHAYYGWDDRTMCAGCVEAVVGVKVIRARGGAHPRSLDRPSESIQGDDREDYLVRWELARDFWEKALP